MPTVTYFPQWPTFWTQTSLCVCGSCKCLINSCNVFVESLIEKVIKEYSGLKNYLFMTLAVDSTGTHHKFEITILIMTWIWCVPNTGLFLFVRRAGLLWSQQDFEWGWSVPLFKCLIVLEFSFILFDLCLLITFFNFIMNYVPIVTFWIFTYHKIWILSIMFCFIWSYWIIYFLACLEVSWRVVS